MQLELWGGCYDSKCARLIDDDHNSFQKLTLLERPPFKKFGDFTVFMEPFWEGDTELLLFPHLYEVVGKDDECTVAISDREISMM